MVQHKTFNWGIVATGNIAHQMADALSLIDNAKITAVLSRKLDNALNFAETYNIPASYDNIDAFLADPHVEIVYVASPHNFHKDIVVKCLNAKKHVLCEKPMGINYDEVNAMCNAANTNGVFLMEAMWSYFFPAMQKVRELISAQTIGDIRLIKSDFCFRGPWLPEGRHLNLNLAGGALLDVGVYNIFFSQMITGQMPTEISGQACIGSTGVDEQCAFTLLYPKGVLASCTCAVQTETIQDAYIYGTDGYIHIPTFWQPDTLTLHKNGEAPQAFNFERFGNGYTYEALEVQKQIADSKLQSDLANHNRSLEVIQTMDTLRKQWDIIYPTEH